MVDSSSTESDSDDETSPFWSASQSAFTSASKRTSSSLSQLISYFNQSVASTTSSSHSHSFPSSSSSSSSYPSQLILIPLPTSSDLSLLRLAPFLLPPLLLLHLIFSLKLLIELLTIKSYIAIILGTPAAWILTGKWRKQMEKRERREEQKEKEKRKIGRRGREKENGGAAEDTIKSIINYRIRVTIWLRIRIKIGIWITVGNKWT